MSLSGDQSHRGHDKHGFLAADPAWTPRDVYPTKQGPGKQRLALEAEIVKIARRDNPISVRHVFYALQPYFNRLKKQKAKAKKKRLAKMSPKQRAQWKQKEKQRAKAKAERLAKMSPKQRAKEKAKEKDATLKAKADYEKVTVFCTVLRREGLLPWEWIVDNTRDHGGRRWDPDPPPEFEAQVYLSGTDEWDWTPPLWQFASPPMHVEVWCETRGMAAALAPVCSRLGVGVTACAGQASDTLIREAAVEMMAAVESGREVRVLYIGDADEDGFNIELSARNKLAHLHGIPLKWRRTGISVSEAAELGDVNAEVIPLRDMKLRVGNELRKLSGEARAKRSFETRRWREEISELADEVQDDDEIHRLIDEANERIRRIVSR